MTKTKAGECIVCNGLMGPPVQHPATTHELCAWLQEGDLAALMPWFTGRLGSVQMGGG